MKSIYLTRKVALGNGTREHGFEICQVNGDPAAALAEANRTRKVPRQIKLSPGVIKKELFTAVANGLLTTANPNTPVESGDQSEVNSILIADLDLSDQLKQALAKVGLSTVEDVSSFGEANNGLTGIDGVTESDQADVLEAIGKAMKSTVDSI